MSYNCPKCNYPDCYDKSYKGLYSPGSRCSVCSYVEADVDIIRRGKLISMGSDYLADYILAHVSGSKVDDLINSKGTSSDKVQKAAMANLLNAIYKHNNG
jgi:hypothetical protein